MTKAALSKSHQSSSVSSLRDEIDSVLGSPSLLAGDDQEQLTRLETALNAHINPQDIFEQIWTREIVEYLFEVLRLRRWKVRVLEVREKYALKQFMVVSQNVLDWTDSLLSRWAEREPEAEKKILNMVSPVERSYEHIEANTVFYNLDALSALDHLLQSAEARKDSAIKELELYRDRKARRSAIGATFKVNADEEVAHAKLQKG